MLARIAAILACGMVSSCQGTIPTPVYQPASLVTVDGSVAVGAFDYRPTGGLGPNEIENENGANWSLQEPVGTYVQKAAAAELRQSGAALDPDSRCSLSGTVREVSITGSRYRTDVEYRLAGTSFDKRIVKETPSTWDFLPADIANYLNKAVSENVGALLSDPGFRAAIRDNCR